MDSQELISTINRINEYGDSIKDRVPVRTKSSDRANTPDRTGNGGKVAKKRLNADAQRNGAVVKKSRRKSTGIATFSPAQMIILAIVCFAIIATLSGVIGYKLWYNSFTDISLAEFTGITLSGYDKHGTAELDIIGKSEYASFFRTVEAKISATENLSNGDELTVSYTFDEEAAKENKLRIDDTDAVITVEGLMAATVINKDMVFSGLDVSFSGISPCISVAVENVSDAPISSEVEFAIENEARVFASGDEIRIAATIPEEYLDNPAYELDMTEDDLVMSYTAPETDKYLSSPDQITDEILSQLENAGYDLIAKSDAKEYGLRIFQQEAHLKPVFVGNTTTFKWASPYVISAYFHNVTDAGKQMLENHANDVQIVYGLTLTQQDGTSCKTEMVIQFVDLVERQDGTIDLNIDSGRIVSASSRNSNIKKLVTNDGNGSYETTKLTE